MVFTAILTICGCFAIIGCHQTASRLTYSFARDNALFFSPKLSTVSETYGVPMFALLANGVVVAIIGCVYLGSTSAFNAMVSTGLILLQTSFAFPAALLLWRKRSVRFLPKNRPFRLGPFGWVANCLTIVFAVVTLIFYCLPTVLPVTAGNMSESVFLLIPSFLLIKVTQTTHVLSSVLCPYLGQLIGLVTHRRTTRDRPWRIVECSLELGVRICTFDR